MLQRAKTLYEILINLSRGQQTNNLSAGLLYSVCYTFALNGTSPLVISSTKRGSGSQSMTWKCSTAWIDFKDLQFLNQMT